MLTFVKICEFSESIFFQWPIQNVTIIQSAGKERSMDFNIIEYEMYTDNLDSTL